MMKTVLVYGDSNTWGYDPARGARLGHDERWGGVIRQQLGADYWVIEEGLGGRTTVFEDPLEEGRNGRTYLSPCLLSHNPIDLVLILLGTNDLKKRFDLPVSDIARGAFALAKIVKRSEAGVDGKSPQVLVICPPPYAPLAGTNLEDMFAGGEEKSKQLAQHFQQEAQLTGTPWKNAGDVMVSSPVDGIHWEASEHRKLGEAAAVWVRELIG